MCPTESPVAPTKDPDAPPTLDKPTEATSHADWLTGVMAGKGTGAPPPGATRGGFAWGFVAGFLIGIILLVLVFAVILSVIDFGPD